MLWAHPRERPATDKRRRFHRRTRLATRRAVSDIPWSSRCYASACRMDHRHALDVAVDAARAAGDILRRDLHRPEGPPAVATRWTPTPRPSTRSASASRRRSRRSGTGRRDRGACGPRCVARLARRSQRSLEDGVVETVMAGGDTDTNAAIAGALLGAVYGRQAVPLQWRQNGPVVPPRAGSRGCPAPRVRGASGQSMHSPSQSTCSCRCHAGPMLNVGKTRSAIRTCEAAAHVDLVPAP